MLISMTSVKPSGRGELLLWLNSVCSAQYPSVESLRDGVAYCTVVDAAVNRVSENCASIGVAEAPAARTRAKHATRLLEHVEWDTTLATSANTDPSLDNIQDRAKCTKNMQTLQLMLRNCVPREFSLEIDVLRLAEGKLQDHIALLKWMYQFMEKMLNTYSRSALQRRTNSSDTLGSVAGVRMTRALQLQQKMIQERYASMDSDQNQGSKGRVSNVKKGNVELKKSVVRNLTSKNTIIDNNNSNRGNAYDESTILMTARSPENAIRSTSESHCKFALLEETNGSLGVHNFKTHDKPISTFTISSDIYSLLTQLKESIEEFEETSFAFHNRHQQSLISSPSTLLDASSGEGCILKKDLQNKSSTTSLENLKFMLEERDRLWQTFEVLNEALPSKQRKEHHNKNDKVIDQNTSPLRNAIDFILQS